eukprot:UN23885
MFSFSNIKQLTLDFERNCILIHVRGWSELTFGSYYMSKKRLGDAIRPGKIDQFFETLETLIFKQSLNKLDSSQSDILSCMLRLINQSSVALLLKMFTGRCCVLDGQVPPVLKCPTRLIRVNSHMKSGSSQIDFIFNSTSTSTKP